VLFRSARLSGGSLTLKFSDTGVGISEENLGKLFVPLFTTKSKGSGLGLAICKRIAEAQGGTIAVESKVGAGTAFTVTIPQPP
jgi:signal transduction histidine kinase